MAFDFGKIEMNTISKLKNISSWRGRTVRKKPRHGERME